VCIQPRRAGLYAHQAGRAGERRCGRFGGCSFLIIWRLPLYWMRLVTYFLGAGLSERGGCGVGRSRGFTGVLVQMQRQAERDARARAAANRRAQVEADRARRAFERAVATDQKERARLYTEARVAEVAALNESLAAGISDLEGLLSSSLAVDDFLDFESLKEAVPLPQFEPGALAVPVPPPPDPSGFRPPEPSAAQKLVPGAKQRYLARFEAGRREYDAAVQAHQLHETERLSQLEQGRAEHQRTVEAIEVRLARQHAEVEALRAAFAAGEPGAVVEYFALVLERSHYPEGFPQGFRLAYIPESRQLVVQYGLPGFGVVPAVGEYRYVRSGDKITQKACPVPERQDRYKRVVAAVTVRTLHEVFEADRSEIAETIVFNGHVDTINEATGKQEYPCLVTLMTTRQSFMDRDFARIDPQPACSICPRACRRIQQSWRQFVRYWSSTWSTLGS
jgi:restriction system protein